MSDPLADNAAARFFGHALRVVGFLVLLLSGLCTGLGVLFGVLASFDAGGPARDIGARLALLEVALAVGIPPILVSLGLVWLGTWLVRRNPNPTKPKPARSEP